MECFRVIGTPQESEWPENVSLNWSFFAQHHSVPLESLLPEICEQGRNILQVLLFCGSACVDVFMYFPYVCVPSEHLYNLRAVADPWG
jgi:hypothetical protein